MTPIDTIFAIAFGFVCVQIARAIRAHFAFDAKKTLYVSEITCPKCHARPGVRCFFSNGGYACEERWTAVAAENAKREANRGTK